MANNPSGEERFRTFLTRLMSKSAAKEAEILAELKRVNKQIARVEKKLRDLR